MLIFPNTFHSTFIQTLVFSVNSSKTFPDVSLPLFPVNFLHRSCSQPSSTQISLHASLRCTSWLQPSSSDSLPSSIFLFCCSLLYCCFHTWYPFLGFHMPVTGHLSWKNGIRKSSYCFKPFSYQTALTFAVANIFNTSTGKASLVCKVMSTWIGLQSETLSPKQNKKPKPKTHKSKTNPVPTPYSSLSLCNFYCIFGKTPTIIWNDLIYVPVYILYSLYFMAFSL